MLASITALVFASCYSMSYKIATLNPRVIIFFLSFFGAIFGFIWEVYRFFMEEG